MTVRLLVMAMLVLGSSAWAGAPYAGMGGVGIGTGSASGDQSDNPSASCADLFRYEGAVFGGAQWRRLAFRGGIMNGRQDSAGEFNSGDASGWGFVTPTMGRGRFSAGAWELDRRGIRLFEPLDLSLTLSPSGIPGATDFYAGESYLWQDEGLYALGVSYVVPLGVGNHIFSLGGAWFIYSSRSILETGAEPLLIEGGWTSVRTVERRRDLAGPGLMASYFFRPIPAGSVGLSALWVGRLTGRAWEKEDAGEFRADGYAREPQMRFGAGAAITVLRDITASLDLRYSGGVSSKNTLFAGTPDVRVVEEEADAVFSASAGAEYRMRFTRFSVPLRLGFSTQPDPAPSSTSGLGSKSIHDLVPPSFRQDLTVFSAGTGFEGGGMRADLAVMWLIVDTRVRKSASDGGTVESGDARNSLGASLSVSMRFGRGG